MEKTMNFLKMLGVYLLYLFVPSFVLILFNDLATSNNFWINNIFSLSGRIVLLIILLVIFAKDFKRDLKEFKSNWKKDVKTAIKIWLVFLLINIVINAIIKFFVGELPNNEALNRSIVLQKPLYAILSMGVLGPFIEEVIFRHNIKLLTTNKYLYPILSALIFGVIHVIGASGLELLYFISYALSGYSFALINQKTNNFYPSVITHMLHNIIALIMIFI